MTQGTQRHGACWELWLTAAWTDCYIRSYQEIEQLMSKLHEDTAAVEEVRGIVKQEEEIMTEETQVVQDYAEVTNLFSHPSLALVLLGGTFTM